MGATTQPTDFSDATTFIYGLIDPRTDQLRYVGKANDPTVRRYQHVCASQLNPRTHKNHWVKSLIKDGLKPEMTILEEVSSDDWEEAEVFWIQYMRFLGCKLVNSVAGGIGGNSPSAETREKIGAASRGKPRQFSAEHIDKIGASNRKRAQDPVWRQGVSERMQGNKNGLGVRCSEETLARMSVAQRRRASLWSEEDSMKFSRSGVKARLLAMKRKACCMVCAVEFTARAWNTLYCSDACCAKAWRERQDVVTANV